MLCVVDAETDAGSREFVQDSEFRWSQDTYNSTQRSIEIWAFIIQLRAKLFLLDQKWSYRSGFSEEQCAPHRLIFLHLAIALLQC